MTIQRYKSTSKGLYKVSNGACVLYISHLGAIDEKDKEITRLRSVIEQAVNQMEATDMCGWERDLMEALNAKTSSS